MLKGKTALVTGSTSGIGLGIALALAKQGANIVLNGFGDVEGPKAEIAALGVQVGEQKTGLNGRVQTSAGMQKATISVAGGAEQSLSLKTEGNVHSFTYPFAATLPFGRVEYQITATDSLGQQSVFKSFF